MDDPRRNPSFTVWMDAEEEKIRSKYKEQRATLSDDAFLAGLSNHDIKGAEALQISFRNQQSFEDEERAVSSFRGKAIVHESNRMRLNELDQKQQIRKAWGLK